MQLLMPASGRPKSFETVLKRHLQRDALRTQLAVTHHPLITVAIEHELNGVRRSEYYLIVP
jgi:hypothetical protein